VTEFQDTSWVRDEFSRHFLLVADAQIPQRSRLRKIIKSFYHFHVGTGSQPTVLDLGSGDGVMTAALLEVDPGIQAVLVDASDAMITRAKQRLSGYPECRFIRISFNDMVKDGNEVPGCDFVISSLAVHHVSTEEKLELFRFIYRKLKPGGWFLLYDSVLPPSLLEDWYILLWIEWIREQKQKKGIAEDMEGFVYSHHQDPGHHKNLDSLEVHLAMIRDAGFSGVDIVYKYGIFSLICGKKV
jgi:tRNA (cmo5U34)-methyltransferase